MVANTRDSLGRRPTGETDLRSAIQQADFESQITRRATMLGTFHSLRVSLIEQGAVTFGANGKGLSADSARLSGFGELVERVSNGMLSVLPGTIRDSLLAQHGIWYSPDEKPLTMIDLCALPPDVKTDLCDGRLGRAQKGFLNELLSAASSRHGVLRTLPFTTFDGQVTIRLPIEFMQFAVGSNGMAAGRSWNHSVSQALAEVLERHAVQTAYFQRLPLPEVPRSVVQRFELLSTLISTVEATRAVQISVRDLSLGKRLPVAAVVLSYGDGNKYRVSAGADSCFEAAALRGLCEALQGISSVEQLVATGVARGASSAQCFGDTPPEAPSAGELSEFAKFIANGRGQWPESLWQRSTLSADYAPDWNIDFGSTAGVESLVAIFRSLGSEPYIRDASWLGIPACWVYAPRLSAVGRYYPDFHLLRYVEFDDTRSQLFALAQPQSSAQGLSRVLDELDRFPDPSRRASEPMRLEFNKSSAWARLPIGFLALALSANNREYERASRNARAIAESECGLDTEFFHALADTYSLAAAGHSAQEILRRHMTQSFASSATASIASCLKRGQLPHVDLAIPRCPDCQMCDLAPDCTTRLIAGMAGRVLEAMKRTQCD